MSSAPRRDPLSPGQDSTPTHDAAMDAVCPFLRSRDGAWSSVWPSVDLRCWAVRPAVPVTVAKQREQCLAAAHIACATYVAAVAASDEGPAAAAGGGGPEDDEAAGLWPATRAVPVALEPVRAMGRLRVPDAIGGQVLLAGLITAALVIFVIARAGAPSEGSGGLASPSPTLEAVVTTAPGASATPASTPAPTPAPTPSPTPARTPAPTPAPTARPVPTPGPSATPARTYIVRKGDLSLYDIGQKLGVSWQAIAKANGIKYPWTIHIGDVLIIP